MEQISHQPQRAINHDQGHNVSSNAQIDEEYSKLFLNRRCQVSNKLRRIRIHCTDQDYDSESKKVIIAVK